MEAYKLIQCVIIGKQSNQINTLSGVGISGTTTKWSKRKFVPSSHPGPFAVVASSRKSQTKVGTLACFDFLYQNELTIYIYIYIYIGKNSSNAIPYLDMIYLAKQTKCDVEKGLL